MTIEKVLPVQIEVDGENPMLCELDCPYRDGYERFCSRYNATLPVKTQKRCPKCLKDFGIPSTQTDLAYANKMLAEAIEKNEKLRASALQQYERAEILLVVNKNLEDTNFKLAEAINSATKVVFVEVNGPTKQENK